jgi:hypothetical protein
MTGWVPQSHISKEDLMTQTKWMRRLAVVYGAALLLLVAFIAANRMLAGPAPGLAREQAPHVARAAAASTRQTH